MLKIGVAQFSSYLQKLPFQVKRPKINLKGTQTCNSFENTELTS